MDSYKPTFSEISLSLDELKILRSFADKKPKDADKTFRPLIDLGLLKIRNMPLNGHKIATYQDVIITRKGQLYLLYLQKEKKKSVIAVLTLVGAFASVVISIVSLLR